MPEQWIDDLVGDEARPRPGFEDQLGRTLQREWRGGRSLRRVAAWVTAAAALVLGAVVVLARDENSSVVPADVSAASTPSSSVVFPSSVPAAAGAPYVAIGDSVMLGAKDLLEADDIVVDASENRSGAGVVEAIDAAVRAGTIGRSSALLVQAGTSGPLSEADLDAVLQRVPADVEPLLLVTLAGPVSWIQSTT
jgi:hypothetical protein